MSEASLDSIIRDANRSIVDAIKALEKARTRVVGALHKVHVLTVDEKLPEYVASSAALGMEGLLPILRGASHRIEDAWDSFQSLQKEREVDDEKLIQKHNG